MYVMLSKRMENKGFADVGERRRQGFKGSTLRWGCCGVLWQVVASGWPTLASCILGRGSRCPRGVVALANGTAKLLFLCKQNSQHEDRTQRMNSGEMVLLSRMVNEVRQWHSRATSSLQQWRVVA
jgi:hypothetical protein